MSGRLLWEVGLFNLPVCMHKQNAADKYEVFIVKYLIINLHPAKDKMGFFATHVKRKNKEFSFTTTQNATDVMHFML